MTTQYEIPLSPSPKRFLISLGGTTYLLQFMYRDAPMGGWVMDINDSLGTPLACGIPLVTQEDLLRQFTYLGFTGEMRVASDGDQDAVPTFENLGIGSHLYWITDP